MAARHAGRFEEIHGLYNRTMLMDTAIQLNPWGFISTERDRTHGKRKISGFQERVPMFLKTSVPGVFAAGGVRQGGAKWVAYAAGDGATAALLIRGYLKTV